MNTWVRRSLKAGALTAGAVMATGTATAAFADTTMVSAGNHGILNGTQVFAPIQAPINICGVAIGILGDAQAGCEGGSAASVNGVYDAKLISHNNHGILNGTQVFAPVQAPINICGVAIGVLGDANAWCEGGADAKLGDRHHKCDGTCKHGTESTTLPQVGSLTRNGLPLVGNAVGGLPVVGSMTGGGLPVVGSMTGGGLPVVGGVLDGVLGSSLLGNGLLGGQSLLGNDVSIAGLSPLGESTESSTILESEGTGGEGGGKPCGTHCPTPPRPTPPKPQPPHHPKPPCADDITIISNNNHGILNGTQIYAPIQAPINVSGIAIGALGDADAWSVGGATARQ